MGENSGSGEDFDELEWIRVRKDLLDEEPVTENRLLRKFKENPFVPIGAVATTACLALGMYNLNLKRSKQQQFYMRARVIAQGFTITALIVGLGFTAIKSDK